MDSVDKMVVNVLVVIAITGFLLPFILRCFRRED